MEEYELEHTGCARQEAVLVRGGNRLCGELTMQGAKNSTLPLLAAALLCEGETVPVSYTHLSHGKRIFKMAPIHHHFEMCGWNENKICFVFSGVTLLAGIIGVLLAVFGC